MPQTRRQRRPEARPDEILDAALAVFGEQGFASARVEDIAKRAGLSKGAVYLYFPSKDAMLNALVEQSAGKLARAAEQLVAIGAPGDPETALRSLIRMLMTAMADPDISAAPRLVLTEAGRSPEIAAHYRSQVLQIARRAMGALLEAGIASGHFRAVDTDALMRLMGGPCMAHMVLTTIFDLQPRQITDPAEMADALCDLILFGLVPRKETA